MTHRYNNIAQLSALGVWCSLALWISSTSAKDGEASVLVKKPAVDSTDGPVLPPPTKPANPTKDFFVPKQPAPAAANQPSQPTSPPNQSPVTSTVKRPFMQPAQPREPARGQLTAESEPMPAPAGPQMLAPPARDPNIRPTPPIDYDTHRSARRMYHSGQIQMAVVTQDPADGCCYDIPLCIPACCTGEPTVSSGHGLFGRGVVEYCWACGFKAKVKFRHILGDVKVEYEGD